MDTGSHSRPGRGGTGTADPVDAYPPGADGRPDAETRPLSRLATADGHPLADAYASRIPPAALAGIAARPFYAALLRLQSGGVPIHRPICGRRGATRN